jgi:hypothetical protein
MTFEPDTLKAVGYESGEYVPLLTVLSVENKTQTGSTSFQRVATKRSLGGPYSSVDQYALGVDTFVNTGGGETLTAKVVQSSQTILTTSSSGTEKVWSGWSDVSFDSLENRTELQIKTDPGNNTSSITDARVFLGAELP